jgi:hypothetical protein
LDLQKLVSREPREMGIGDIHFTQVARWPPQQVEKNAVCGHKILWQPA